MGTHTVVQTQKELKKRFILGPDCSFMVPGSELKLSRLFISFPGESGMRQPTNNPDDKMRALWEEKDIN